MKQNVFIPLVVLLLLVAGGLDRVATAQNWPEIPETMDFGAPARPVLRSQVQQIEELQAPATPPTNPAEDGFPGVSGFVDPQAVPTGLCPADCGAGAVRFWRGVDEASCRSKDCEPLWRDEHLIPWEAFAWGEYVGPHRTPHVPCYRVRVGDEIEFVYQLTREQSMEPYRLMVGDVIEVTSSADPDLNQKDITILSDGSISLRLIGRVMAARKTIQELQDELNARYGKYFETEPAIVVRGTRTETNARDLIDAVDARYGTGGQARLATVSPDGTVQLPMIGSVPAIGLTLDELNREVNMRYREKIQGFAITPVLVRRAPRYIYVLGEVDQPGRFELTGPTTAMQALSLAGGWNIGGNTRQIVVFRRDENWRLMAVRLDLAGSLFGKRPFPSDEIWLRDSDIVLVPKTPIQRVADMVDLHFTQTIYSVIPIEFFYFDFPSRF